MATASTTGRQPPASARAASPGTKIRVPVAVLAVRSPIARPRLVANQRLTTVAPSTIATQPEARPDSTPQLATSCHGSVMKRTERRRPRQERKRADQCAAEADLVHQRCREWTDQAIEKDADRRRERDRRPAPAERLFERQDQHARRAARTRRNQEGEEDDANDDEGVFLAKRPGTDYMHVTDRYVEPNARYRSVTLSSHGL